MPVCFLPNKMVKFDISCQNIPVRDPHTFSECPFLSVDIQTVQLAIDDSNDVSILGSIFVAYVLITLKSSLPGALTPGTWLRCPFSRQCRLQYEWCGFHYIVHIVSTFILHFSLLCIYRNYFMMGFNFVGSVLLLFCWLLNFAFHGYIIVCSQCAATKKNWL